MIFLSRNILLDKEFMVQIVLNKKSTDIVKL